MIKLRLEYDQNRTLSASDKRALKDALGIVEAMTHKVKNGEVDSEAVEKAICNTDSVLGRVERLAHGDFKEVCWINRSRISSPLT